MRRGIWIALVAALVAFPLVVIAQDAGPDPGPGGGGPGPGAGGGPRGGGFGQQFLREYDTNGDGKISKEEWADAFAKMDLDGDGFVTQEELQKFAEQQREQYWKSLDKNADGAISRDEWPGREQGFNRLDTNGDGSISKEEMAQAQERMRQWRRDRESDGGQGGDQGGGGQ